MDFSGSLGHTNYRKWEQQIAFQNKSNSPQWLFEDSWSLSDIWDASSPLIPGKYPMALRERDGDNTYWPSSFWLQKVYYIKLKNLELGYNFPQKWLANTKTIGSCRVYLAATNLFALTNVQGIDPEQDLESGIGYPTMRVINIGINIKFQ
jgi:hypothetical protein